MSESTSQNPEATKPEVKGWTSQVGPWITRYGKWVWAAPVSLALAALMVVVRIVAQSVGADTLIWNIASGVGEPWWTVFISLVWTSTWLHLVVDVVLLLSLGAWVERKITSRLYALVGLGSAWAGTALALGGAQVISLVDRQWAEALAPQYISGITAFVVGTALAVSLRLDTLWRRRIQIVVFTILGVAVLFSGSIDSIATLLAGIIGWGIGFVLWGKNRDRRALTGTRREGRVLVAIIVAAVTVGTMMALRSPDMVGALATLRGDLLLDVNEDDVAQVCNTAGMEAQCAHMSYMLRSTGFASRLMPVLPLLLQLVLAWGLRGGRRAAFWGTMVVQGGSALLAVAHLVVVRASVSGFDAVAGSLGMNEDGVPSARLIIPIVVPLTLLLLVAANYKIFTVKAAAGTYTKFWTRVGVVTGIVLVIYIAVGLAMRHTFTPEATLFGLIGDFFVRLLPVPALYLISPQFQSDSMWLSRATDWLALMPWLAAIVFLLPSFGKRALPNAAKRERYKEIVRATNAGTMAWMSTWEGNDFWESQKYEAGVAYRSDLGVALTVTDPAAHPEDLEEVMKEFADFCSSQGMIPAFYSVHGPVTAVTDSWGWPRLQVAEETVLELPGLAFKGKSFQGIRTALNRGTKEGIRPVWTTWQECPPDLAMQIEAMSEQWASGKGLPEMGFTLGGVDELDDPDVMLLLAVDEDDKLHGATSWMPVYEQGKIIGWTLDFMRRRDDGFRPAMEYMIAQAALWAQQENYQILSLSGAPLAKAQPAKNAASEVDEDGEEGSSSAALDFILETLGKNLEPVYGFRSLLQFKAKFRPTYTPVYLSMPDVGSLATVGLAIGHAYLPDMTVSDTARLVKALRDK